MKKDLDVLMVGHFAKDKIVVDGNEEICPGGAVYYGSVVLNRLGLDVGVASRGNPEDFPSLQPLMDMGIEFDLHPASQSSGCINIYNSADMDHRICKLFGFAGEIPYEDILDVKAKIWISGRSFRGVARRACLWRKRPLPVLRPYSNRLASM